MADVGSIEEVLRKSGWKFDPGRGWGGKWLHPELSSGYDTLQAFEVDGLLSLIRKYQDLDL